MHTWDLAQRGLEAYRFQTCSRTLVAHFTWVWLTLLALSIFVFPTWNLIQAHPKYSNPLRRISHYSKQKLQKAVRMVCSSSDKQPEMHHEHPPDFSNGVGQVSSDHDTFLSDCSGLAKDVNDNLATIASMYTAMLTFICFGSSRMADCKVLTPVLCM